MPLNKSLKIMVYVHIYYHDMWNELETCIENLKSFDHLSFDLVVTVVKDDQFLFERLKAFKSDVKIIKVLNKGYDLGPFVEVLNIVDLDKYDYLIKLHTKRDIPYYHELNHFILTGQRWRHKLLSFISSRTDLKKCFQCLENDDNAGLIANYAMFSRLCCNKGNETENWIFNEAEKLLKKMGLQPYPQDNCVHVSGTMFIMRCKLLNPLKKLNLSINSFKAVERENIKDLPHVLEVLLGWMTTSQTNNQGQHYRIVDPFSSRIFKVIALIRYLLPYRFVRKIIRFVYRVEVDPEGKFKIIKIFKIPVLKL